MPQMKNRQLSPLHVLVTRPQQMANELCAAIESHGGRTTHFPTIEITEPRDSSSLHHALKTVDDFDFALFISPTAVRKTAEHIHISAFSGQLIALGSATTTALENEGCRVSIKPNGHDSEALLDHPQLQTSLIQGKRIIIFKGEGGRNLLEKTLTERGAITFAANIYRRTQPTKYTPLDLKTLQSLDAILISSGESLNNLVNMAVNKQALFDKTVLVPGKRCKTIAINLGFNSVIETNNATNAAFIEALLNIANALGASE